MKTALLIADLEGIAGVDDARDLALGGAGHAAACARMTHEVRIVCDALLRNGWDAVRVSDSHRSGSETPNVNAADLPPGTTLHWDEDAYAPELFEGIEAVACLGMHAGGRTHGFGAHTVQVHAAWRCGFQPVDETGIVLALAREANARVLFVSGDQVLAQSVGKRAPFVLTKRAISVLTARSFPAEVVDLSLARAATAEGQQPPLPPKGPIAVSFKTSHRTVHAQGHLFSERYKNALALCHEAISELEPHVRGAPGSTEFAQSAAELLNAPWR
jgi:D-amino peptidase